MTWPWLLSIEKEGAGDEGGGGESDELANLIAEGEEGEKEETAEETKPEDGEEETTEEESGDDLGDRITALEDSVAQARAETAYWKGEASKRQAPKELGQEPALYDRKQMLARLTDKDPEVALAAVEELADKIAEKRFKALQDETAGMITVADSVRSAKESDRSAVMADFEVELQDPKFVEALSNEFRSMQQEAGGRYLPRSLYRAAAAVKVTFDRQQARAKGARNGVTPVRPVNGTAEQTTTSTAHDFSKAKKIGDIPDSILSPREKMAARAAIKKMGITEEQYVTNLKEVEAQ